MSLISKRSFIKRIRRGKESRERLVSSNLDKGIAFQIRATRDKREWTQSELAAKAGMTQNNLSRLESPDYGKHTISSLKRIAEAFDVALVVRFVPFSQYIDWLSGTPRVDNGLSENSLAVPSFEQEEMCSVFQNEEIRILENQAYFWGPLASGPAYPNTLSNPKTYTVTGWDRPHADIKNTNFIVPAGISPTMPQAADPSLLYFFNVPQQQEGITVH